MALREGNRGRASGKMGCVWSVYQIREAAKIKFLPLSIFFLFVKYFVCQSENSQSLTLTDYLKYLPKYMTHLVQKLSKYVSGYFKTKKNFYCHCGCVSFILNDLRCSHKTKAVDRLTNDNIYT